MYLQLSAPSLESRPRINCLSLYGHVKRSEKSIRYCTQIEVVGCQGRGRPHKTWKEFLKEDLCLWNTDPNMVHD